MGSTASTTRHAKKTGQVSHLSTKTAPGSPVAVNTVQVRRGWGSHVFEISGYSQHRDRVGDLNVVTSAVFAVGGYDWQIVFCPVGILDRVKDYVQVFLFLRSKDKDARVRASFQLSLVDVAAWPDARRRIP